MHVSSAHPCSGELPVLRSRWDAKLNVLAVFHPRSIYECTCIFINTKHWNRLCITARSMCKASGKLCLQLHDSKMASFSSPASAVQQCWCLFSVIKLKSPRGNRNAGFWCQRYRRIIRRWFFCLLEDFMEDEWQKYCVPFSKEIKIPI